jgi:hypothetical protein
MDILDTSVMIPMRPSSKNQSKIPIYNWKKFAMTVYTSGISSISGLQPPVKGSGAFLRSVVSSRSAARYSCTFWTSDCTYLLELVPQSMTLFGEKQPSSVSHPHRKIEPKWNLPSS